MRPNMNDYLHADYLNNQNPIKRPPVRYFGGKWRIAPKIIQHFPPHTTYVEPFCGGSSLLFRKIESHFECLNDLNGAVINFFKVLRNRPEDLVRAIDLTPYSREEHKLAHLPGGDDLENARRFYVRSRQSFGSGEGTYNTGWRFQVNNRRGSSAVDEWNTFDHLLHSAKRLKNVQLENDDAMAVIKRWDGPQTLFYVDPPYPFSTRHSNEHRYAHEMTDDQHHQLADLLKSVKGMVIVSTYPNEMYQDHFSRWKRFDFETRTNDNHQAIESIYLNPAATDLHRLPMFRLLENSDE